MAKKTKRRRQKTTSSASRVELTPEEQQVALAELGLRPDQLVPQPTPTWAYLAAGVMVFGALALSARLVTR